jgi:hypothetical protein
MVDVCDKRTANCTASLSYVLHRKTFDVNTELLVVRHTIVPTFSPQLRGYK